MEISLTTPALLFPTVSLLMLAYTNRFLTLATIIRNLHDRYTKEQGENILGQIKNLRYRLKLIKNMQALGVVTFLSCILCMYLIYIDSITIANIVFAFSLITFSASLALSLLEIQLSTKALELELSDIEGLEDPSVIEYLKKKFEKE